jgi:hypothetical protein
MEYYLDNISKQFIETYKSKETKINQFSEILKIIILSENNNIKFENFKNFVSFGKEKMDDEEIYIYHFFSMYLYLLEVHRDFKNDLLNFFKDKNLKSVYEKVVRHFLDIFKSSECKDSILNNIFLLKVKIKVFNNFFEASRLIIPEQEIIQDEIINDKFHNLFIDIIKSDLTIHLKNVNEEVFQFFIMFFKYFYSFYKGIKTEILLKEYSGSLKDLLQFSESLLITHVNEIEMVQFNKDFEFNLSTSIFLLINLLSENKEDYIKNSLNLLRNFDTSPNHLFIYLKSFIINCPNLSEDILLDIKLNFFNHFFNKYLITLNNEKSTSTHSLMEFYKIFLENDLKSNFTTLINEIILISIHRMTIINPDTTNMTKLHTYLKENSIVEKLFSKMNRDKNNFNIMDDNYYFILESIHKLNEELKSEVETLANTYLNDLISKKERLMMIEAKMFKFIDFGKEDEKLNTTQTIKSFFAYIFSKPYEKKNLSLINEYIKILFDFFFASSLNNNKDPNSQMNVYNRFISIFPQAFFNYLVKLDTKDLKFFNNILINLEKFNKNLYSIIVNEFYQNYFINKNNNLDYVHKFSIFLTLLRPFKNHKRTLMIKDDKLIFDLTILENLLHVKFSVELKELANLTKLSDRYIVLYLIEFLNGLDEQEKVFPIIETLLRYNVKSSYVEYKSSLTKALTTYFREYVDKIGKYLVKSKPTNVEFDFIQKSVNNYKFLFAFLSDNIYDRPVENLLVYLEVLKLNMDLFDNLFYSIKIKNESMKKHKDEFVTLYEKNIFNKGLSLSLISLLRQSWYFVRYTVFSILKNQKFEVVLSELRMALTTQIADYFYSLRQMDAEGSVNLFLLLLHHFKEDFLSKFGVEVLKTNLNQNGPVQLKMKCIDLFNQQVIQRQQSYLKVISEKDSDKNICDYSVHSYYVLIRNLLEEEKDSSEVDCNLLLDVGMQIIDLNFKLSQYLLNNGVAEFSTDFEMDDVTDGEDKGLISLWCCAKYSIESLNIILDIINNNYKLISKHPDFENKLKVLEIYLNKIIELMIEYKHMGAVTTFNESLLKVAKILNRGDDIYKSYRDITAGFVKDFLETKLINEEVCSILRRSAGIPFILTTLIKSYISHDKLSTFSHNKVVEILKSAIEMLLTHYKTYQNLRPDSSVHCLHILRVISDDTHLKPYAKDFYDYIILKIVDGLGNANWSIKNACMLLFSRLIKNSFTLHDIREKNILTFVEYFTGKEELKNKIFVILRNEINNSSSECSDSLVLLITFFSKFKKSKLAEINEKDLTDMIDLLFGLVDKNNKLFRKLLCTCIVKLYGDNIKLGYEKILGLFNGKNNFNNKIDFIFNLLKLINVKDSDFLTEIDNKCTELLNLKENFLVLNKVVKYYLKTASHLKVHDKLRFILELEFEIKDNNSENKIIKLQNIFSNLKKYSRRPFYGKLVKNTVTYFLKTGEYSFSDFSFDLIQPYNEEFLNVILKKFPKYILHFYTPSELIKKIIDEDLLSKLNVNISTKVIDYIMKTQSYSETFSVDISLSEKLLDNLINLTNESKAITKLVKKLLNFISKLFIVVQKKEFIEPLLKLIFQFSTSHNEEKMRSAALQTFETILLNTHTEKFFNKTEINCLDQIMIIFTFTINDEHPEIRNYACQILTEFISHTQLFDYQINSQSGLVYSNEYFMDKITGLLDQQIEDENIQKRLKYFFEYLINENLYFLGEKAKFNNENKVFYYEPENRYIDNIEIKIKILRSLICGKKTELKGLINTTTGMKGENKNNLQILTMLESFVEFITNNFGRLHETMSNTSEDLTYLFINLRKQLYQC